MISEKNRFIFIHYPRTGGSVFEQTYRQLYEPDNDPRLEVGGKNQKHYSATDYEEHYPREMRDFFTFSFLRNPYDVVVSLFFNTQQYKKMTFADYLYGPAAKRALVNYDSFFFLGDTLAVKKIIFFENYDQDMAKLCASLDIELPIKKLDNTAIKERYTDLDFNEYKRIANCVSIAIEAYNKKTGDRLAAPIPITGDYAQFKTFVIEALGLLKNYFLNEHHLKVTERYIHSSRTEQPMKRDLDFNTYYQQLPDMAAVKTLFEQYCPRILELGQYKI